MLGIAELVIILVILVTIIGVPLAILLRLRLRRKICHHCQRRIHRATTVCPFCQREQRPVDAA